MSKLVKQIEEMFDLLFEVLRVDKEFTERLEKNQKILMDKLTDAENEIEDLKSQVRIIEATCDRDRDGDWQY